MLELNSWVLREVYGLFGLNAVAGGSFKILSLGHLAEQPYDDIVAAPCKAICASLFFHALCASARVEV